MSYGGGGGEERARGKPRRERGGDHQGRNWLYEVAWLDMGVVYDERVGQVALGICRKGRQGGRCRAQRELEGSCHRIRGKESQKNGGKINHSGGEDLGPPPAPPESFEGHR